jgi:hypothetical protein
VVTIQQYLINPQSMLMNDMHMDMCSLTRNQIAKHLEIRLINPSSWK